MTTAAFVGTSITADQYLSNVWHPSGMYAPIVAGQMGWTLDRQGIPGSCLDDRYSYDFHPASGIATIGARAVGADVLVIEYGANDWYFMGSGADLATWGDAWTRFWAQIPTRPVTYVLGLPPLANPPTKGLPAWAYDAAWLRGEMDAVTHLHTRSAGARFVDLAGMTAEMLRDGTHPSMRGHCQMAGALLAALGQT